MSSHEETHNHDMVCGSAGVCGPQTLVRQSRKCGTSGRSKLRSCCKSSFEGSGVGAGERISGWNRLQAEPRRVALIEAGFLGTQKSFGEDLRILQEPRSLYDIRANAKWHIHWLSKDKLARQHSCSQGCTRHP